MVQPSAHQKHHGEKGFLIKPEPQVKPKRKQVTADHKKADDVKEAVGNDPLPHQFLQLLTSNKDTCKGFKQEPDGKCRMVGKDFHQGTPGCPGMFLHCK